MDQAQQDAEILLQVALEEKRQQEKIIIEQKQQAEAIQKQAKLELESAIKIRQEAETVQQSADNLLQRAKPFKKWGNLIAFLFNGTKRAERKIEKQTRNEIESLKTKINQLEQRSGNEQALKRDRTDLLKTLKALNSALLQLNELSADPEHRQQLEMRVKQLNKVVSSDLNGVRYGKDVEEAIKGVIREATNQPTARHQRHNINIKTQKPEI